MTNENNKNLNFMKDYYEFIYLNSFLTEDEALDFAIDSWNKGLDRCEALKQARKIKK